MQELAFTIHRAEEGGFWAEAEGYPLFTQGEDLDELEGMIRQAVSAYFADPAARQRSGGIDVPRHSRGDPGADG